MPVIFHIAVFERIAPEIVLDRFEPEFGDQHIQRMGHVFARFGQADIQRLGILYAVTVVEEPFRMLPIVQKSPKTRISLNSRSGRKRISPMSRKNRRTNRTNWKSACQLDTQ